MKYIFYIILGLLIIGGIFGIINDLTEQNGFWELYNLNQ